MVVVFFLYFFFGECALPPVLGYLWLVSYAQRGVVVSEYTAGEGS